MKARKQKGKARAPRPTKIDYAYAGMFWHEPKGSLRRVYVGGSYYGESAQIHLTANEVHRLAVFLSKASAYLKEKQ